MRLKGVSIFKPRRRSKRHHPWLMAYGMGKNRKVISGSTSYEDTVALAERVSRTLQRSYLNLGAPEEVRREIQRVRPLTDHLNEYEKFMMAQGKTQKHATQMRLCAEESLETYATVDAIVASEVQTRIAKLKGGRNRRVYAVGHFLRWGVKDTRWPESVAERIKLTRFPVEHQKKRRILGLADLAKLTTTAQAGATIAGISGRERALIYRVMLATGLRLGELSRIRISHLSGDGFDLPAAITKNRKGARCALPSVLADEIRALISNREDAEHIFHIPSNPHRLIQHDLAAAGIQRKTPEGVFDWHSLRHQSGMLLIVAGVNPKAVQQHMRHSSIKLTLDTYGHVMDRDRKLTAEVMSEVVQRLDQRDGVNMGEQNPDTNLELRQPTRLSEACDSAVIPLDHRPDDDTQRLLLQIFGIKTAHPVLAKRKGRPIAPRQAQRLLGRVFKRAMQRAARGGGR